VPTVTAKAAMSQDVVLSSISFDLASGHDIELWNTVLRQLHLEEMPPTESEQPEQHERDAVMLWINTELKKSGNASDLYSKLESPSFGNYVNHEKAFQWRNHCRAFFTGTFVENKS
jgi:hypothetical protein